MSLKKVTYIRNNLKIVYQCLTLRIFIFYMCTDLLNHATSLHPTELLNILIMSGNIKVSLLERYSPALFTFLSNLAFYYFCCYMSVLNFFV